MAAPDHTARRGRQRPRSAGFTYVGLLLFIAVFGLMSALALRSGLALERHAAEQELLERGLRLEEALDAYARNSGPGRPMRPRRIEDLLRDPRFPNRVIRHLRRIEPDPITGRREWGVHRDNIGGIMGFYSLSDQRVQRREFKGDFKRFNGKAFYRQWVFGVDPDA